MARLYYIQPGQKPRNKKPMPRSIIWKRLFYLSFISNLVLLLKWL